MDRDAIRKKLAAGIDQLAEVLALGCVEFACETGTGLVSLDRRELAPGREYLTLDALREMVPYLSAPDAPSHSVSLAETGTDLHCGIYRMQGKSPCGFMIVQHTGVPPAHAEAVLRCFAGTLGAADECIADTDAGADGKRYKDALNSMRSIQAALFPRFDDVQKMDLAAVYLPADALSGNFIDGFALDAENYQFVICDVYESETQSSFIGTMVRALVRSYSSPRVVPSALLEQVTMKLGSISGGVSYKISLNVVQVNHRSGKARISSYGRVNTLFFVAKNKKVYDLGKSSIGAVLASQTAYKDIPLQMEAGDILLYYSRGVCDAVPENVEIVYGEARIGKDLISHAALSSKEMVHETIDSVFEYTGYAPVKKDLVLIAMRRTA
jgi:hypothetical protein